LGSDHNSFTVALEGPNAGTGFVELNVHGTVDSAAAVLHQGRP
jgi:hypothetical protein